MQPDSGSTARSDAHAPGPTGSPVVGLTIFKAGLIHAALHHAKLGAERNNWFLKRLGVVLVVLWLPLFLLCILEGVAFPGQVTISFISDWSVHARLLVVIPLFLCADAITEPQLIKTQKQFLSSGLIRDDDKPVFERVVAETGQLARNRKAETAILGLVVLLALFGVRREPILGTTSWLFPGSEAQPELIASRVWFFYVCIPVYQFILLTWLWRYGVWTGFIWRVSRLSLRLNGAHPDRAGGLGFVTIGQTAFVALVVGFSIIYAGTIAKDVVYNGAELVGFVPEIGILMGVSFIIFLTPLLTYSPQLVRLRVKDVRRYSRLSGAVARRFTQRWSEADNHADDVDRLLESSEVDTLANLTVVFGTVKRIRFAPIDLVTASTIAAATLGPMLPLVLTVYTPGEVLDVIKSVVL